MCSSTGQDTRSGAERINAYAASLATVLSHHGIDAKPDRLIALIKSDWGMVAKYAHKIHDGDRRHDSGRKDRRVELHERLAPSHRPGCASEVANRCDCGARP